MKGHQIGLVSLFSGFPGIVEAARLSREQSSGDATVPTFPSRRWPHYEIGVEANVGTGMEPPTPLILLAMHEVPA